MDIQNSEKVIEITFVTGNDNKFKEFLFTFDYFMRKTGNKYLKNIIFKRQKLNLEEIQGTAEEICTKKCLKAAEITGKSVLVDDTSLFFEAFGNLPGPYIKDFLKNMGVTNVPKLLDSFENKKAVAQTIFAFYDDKNKKVELFVGRTEGEIVQSKGDIYENSWNSIFQVKQKAKNSEEIHKTLAEMCEEEKKAINYYRMKAFEKFFNYLVEKYN